MKPLTPENIWQMNEKDLLVTLDKGLLISERKRIRFYVPSFMYYNSSHFRSGPADFPTVSVTGKGCALKCKHCGGIVLDTMYSATTPQRLLELCRDLKRKGALGCLISGGCLPNGSVPMTPFLDVIRKIKHELDLAVFVHTGIVNNEMANGFKNAGVDVALIDIIGSDQTIREIYNMDVKVKDYEDSLKALHGVGLPFVPHVIAGLYYGKLKGEWQALKMISRHDPFALVVIAFMPIRGTEMESVAPPEPFDTIRVLATARMMFPKTPLVLGCMRPRGKSRNTTDVLAIKAGVDAVAFPTEEAVRFAESCGLDVTFSSFCCAQVYSDIRDLSTACEKSRNMLSKNFEGEQRHFIFTKFPHVPI
jgi:uncharacterized radical SAM superfamily protein